jgi:hypothetical protein
VSGSSTFYFSSNSSFIVRHTLADSAFPDKALKMPQFNLQEEVIAISNPADLSLYSIENELDLDSLSAREVDDALESESSLCP